MISNQEKYRNLSKVVIYTTDGCNEDNCSEIIPMEVCGEDEKAKIVGLKIEKPPGSYCIIPPYTEHVEEWEGYTTHKMLILEKIKNDMFFNVFRYCIVDIKSIL